MQTKAQQAYVVDMLSGQTLYSKNSKEKMAPSSMSKLMTLYLVFERLKNGDLKLTEEFLVSPKAWKKQGSKTFLEPGQSVKVEDLIRGVVIQSGNDAAIALAEGLAGSEDAFVTRMNDKARELGLKHSHFKNSTGWPDPGHVMSPEDLAKLSKKIILEFPEYYKYFAEKSFKFNGIKQNNRNTLLSKNLGVDGLKTGHSSLGGYGVVVTGEKNGRRLIVIVNGLNSEKDRQAEAYKLLQYGFLNFKNVEFARANTPVIQNLPTWLGNPGQINLVTHEDIIFTYPIDMKNKLEAVISYPSFIKADTKTTDPVGKITITDGKKTKEYPIFVQEEVTEQGFLSRIISWIKQFFKTFSLDSPKPSTEKKEMFL